MNAIKGSLLALALMLGAAGASADFLTGWKGTIKWSDDGVYHSQTVVADSADDCVEKLAAIAADLEKDGITAVPGPCAPSFAPNLPVHFDPNAVPSIDRCPLCQYLVPDLIDAHFADRATEVHNLIDDYRIDLYQEDVIRVQQSYDLAGFERKLFELERRGTPTP